MQAQDWEANNMAAVDGTTPANFEINDITIVFRLKGQR